MARPSKTSISINSNITIYPRPLQSGDVWYARFSINKPELAEGKRTITETLKTLDKQEAIERAQRRYMKICVLEEMGHTIKGKYVRDAITDYMDEYKQRMDARGDATFRKGSYTPTMYRHYRKTIVRYWMEYCPDLELKLVSYETFDAYETWRRTYFQRQIDVGNHIHGNSKKSISDRTIQMEINAMKVCLRWARNNRYYTGSEITFRFDAHRGKRHSFTLEQYMKLVRYMRTNNFYEKGKHGNDSLIRRSREQIRTYILFLANTGLRAGTEVRLLRWRDIEFSEKDGNKYIRVSVPSSGKSRKPRIAIGRNTARRALERMRERRTDNIGEDDYIFCRRDGTPIKNFREIFDSVIEEAGVKYHLDGDRKIKYTPYCLRHTYITFRLRYTKNLNLIRLARQCGTSVAMIESNYDATLPEEHLDEFL